MSELWVAPKIVCGLGNRLFQTIAAIAFAKSVGREVVFFLPRLSQEHGDFLLFLQLFPTIRVIESAPAWVTVREDNPFGTIPKIILNEESLSSQPIVLSGHFMNTEHFPKEEYLPHLPEPLYPPTNSIAIHFRFGDYLILPHHQIPLGHYYYHVLTTQIKDKKRPLTLFSDSADRLPRIMEELKTLGYENISICNSIDTLETLKHFSACQGGAICSNSTFSWWAAFFASRNNTNYQADFPDSWVIDKESPNIFTLPFTRVWKLSEIPAVPFLKSFSYS
jgi:hypothetical protein